MSKPDLLVETDVEMIANFNLRSYFLLIIKTLGRLMMGIFKSLFHFK